MTKTADGDLDADFKAEEDWAGERRVLSISLTAERPKGLVAAAAAREQRGISALLNHDQWRLIDECAGIVVDPAALTMLPAMSAMRWPPSPCRDRERPPWTSGLNAGSSTTWTSSSRRLPLRCRTRRRR